MSFFDGLASVLLVQALVASIAVWGYWLHHWSRGRSPIRWQPREPVPWGGIEIAVIAVIYLLVPSAVYKFFPPIFVGAQRDIFISTLGNGLVVLVVPMFLVGFVGSRWADLGLRRAHLRRDVLYGLVALLAATLPVLVVQLLVRTYLASEEQVHPIVEAILQNPTLTMWYLVSVSAVVYAPVTEELLFRVVLQGWLEKRLHPALAIAGSSVSFAAMHSTSWPDPLPLLPLAGVLGYVYYRRHSLLAPVVLHASFNAVNLVILGFKVSKQATGAV